MRWYSWGASQKSLNACFSPSRPGANGKGGGLWCHRDLPHLIVMLPPEIVPDCELAPAPFTTIWNVSRPRPGLPLSPAVIASVTAPRPSFSIALPPKLAHLPETE